MARRKTPEDQEWENIFNNILLHVEPEPQYIKKAEIITHTGQKYKLNGVEFVNIMDHERHLDPQDMVVASCKVVLDFDRIKHDVNIFTTKLLNKTARRHPRSKQQQKQQRALKKLPQRPASVPPS